MIQFATNPRLQSALYETVNEVVDDMLPEGAVHKMIRMELSEDGSFSFMRMQDLDPNLMAHDLAFSELARNANNTKALAEFRNVLAMALVHEVWGTEDGRGELLRFTEKPPSELPHAVPLIKVLVAADGLRHEAVARIHPPSRTLLEPLRFTDTCDNFTDSAANAPRMIQ